MLAPHNAINAPNPRGFGTVARELPLARYAAGNFGKNLVWSGADVTLLFLLTDLLGIAPAAAGTLMLIAFMGDLLCNLLVGALVSWARQFGLGYRSFIVAGALPCGGAFALLYAMPALGERQFWVLAATLLVFRGAYAVIDVPHNALIASITSDSRARGRVSGYRLFFSSLASLAVATILAPSVQGAAVRMSPAPLAMLALLAGLLFFMAMLVAATAAPERAERRRLPASSFTFFPKPDALFAAMALIAFITGFATPMFQRMMLYYATYVLDQPNLVSKVFFAVTLGQFPGVLFWTALVRRFEKTTLLAAGHAVALAGMLLFALAGSNLALLMACSLLIGGGLASIYMLPWGILADAVDFAEFRHGDRREAAMFACFLVIIKASGAASLGLMGWTMAVLGYVPGVTQSPALLTAFALLQFGLPIVGSVAAIALLRRLSMGYRRHALVVDNLKAREARRAAQPLDDPPSPKARRRRTMAVQSIALKNGNRFSAANDATTII